MEWHIMNAGGINSLSGSMGCVDDGEFVPSPHCEESLNTLLSQTKDEDAAYRNVRRQVFYNKLVEKELIPMLKYLKDDTTLYALVIKLMSVLTQPVECLVNTSVYSTVPSHPVHIPWQSDLETSLRAYRKLCIDEELLSAIMTEVQTILTDNEGCSLSDESCDVITDVLLLLRNLLHLPEENEDNKQNQEQELFLRMLFQCGLTDRIMSLLNLQEREIWSVPMVQMISLLYKGHVGEMFCKGLKMEESVLSTMRYDEYENDVFSKFERLSELGNDIANNLRIDPEIDLDQESHSKSESNYIVNGIEDEDGLRKHLLNFTHQFLEKGFSSLVNDLKHILINRKKIVLDDVYLLWLIAFFLKFARCENVPLKTIRTIFSTEIFGFLVYEGVSNMEYLLIAQRKKQDLANTLRRIHMTVDALREMLQFLKICQDRKDMEKDDIVYLDRLKGDLTDMYDLRQFLLLLTRYFQLHIHSLKFLCDVVVTNHLFLLLMEVWMNGGLVRKNFNMLDHIKQFATVEVMKNYGVLVENVQYNNLMVNNCLFTMMHHVAGDCGKPEVLLQVHILKTFLDISEKDIIMTQEMEDLIEYVLQTFVLAAENNPLTCAIQLFGEDKQQTNTEQSSSEQSVHEDDSEVSENKEDDTDKWTEEEEDVLMMLFTEYQQDCNFAEKIRVKLEDYGIEKSVDEVVVYLTALGWIPSEDEEEEEKLCSKEELESRLICEMDQSEKPLQDSETKDFSSLKESEVVPYCIKQLNKDGFDSCVEWLKRQFCEVAYIKYVSMHDISKGQETEEPIAKHYVAQNKSVPLVLYNELQEHVIHNKHFVQLMSNLGLHMPEDVGMIFPRIPHWWSIQHLIDSARQLGGNSLDLKFDITSVKQDSGIQSEVTDIRMDDFVACDTHTSLNSYTKRLPNTMWMDVIQQINKTLVNEKVYGENGKNGEDKRGFMEQLALQVNIADRTSAMDCVE